MVDERWARLSLVGPEFPDLLGDVDPTLMRRASMAAAEKIKFYRQAVMKNVPRAGCVRPNPGSAWSER
jgi:hypothetical protein